MKSIDLDFNSQKDLYDQACQYMAECIPGWNDNYPSDPAVAILEYLTYLSDIQNHQLNQVEEEHYKAYLKLLGTSIRPVRPAELMAMPDPTVSVFPGQRFQIDHVTFEADKERQKETPVIDQIKFQDQILNRNAIFELPGGQDGVFVITLNKDLPARKKVSIWCLIDPEKERNAPEKETPAPIRWTAKVGGIEVPCEDSTCGMLKSGMITFTPENFGREITLQAHGIWEGNPKLKQMVLEPVHLVQQRTRSTYQDLKAPFKLPVGWEGNKVLYYFTPTGDGWREETKLRLKDGYITGWAGDTPSKIRVVALEPNFKGTAVLQGLTTEKIHLDEPGLCPESLQVMIEQQGIWHSCPQCLPQKGKTLPWGFRWESAEKSLRFGNGRDYLIPKPGKVLISNCIITRGSKANGAVGVLKGDGINLFTLTNASGGQDTETAKEAFLRSAREQDQICRAVTCQDYEVLARKTPGLALDKVRAITRADLGEEGPGVIVLVQPYSEQNNLALSSWQKEQLFHFLDPLRMLGVPLEIRGAKYCPIRVQVSVTTSEPISAETIRQKVLALTDGVKGPLDFGDRISYTALYAAIEKIPHVRFIRRLELIPLTSKAHRTQDGSIQLAPDMLPYLREFEKIE